MRLFRWVKERHWVLVASLVAGFTLALVHSVGAEVTGGLDVIPAPNSVEDSSAAGGAFNDHQQAFNERQVVVLPVNVATDSGVIPAGTAVSSHMIFLNIEDCGPLSGTACVPTGDTATWTFSHDILGVMSDQGGLLEASSSALLGAPGTVYPGPFPSRGLEPASLDTYAAVGNIITVTMVVSQPGDWIRVVTEATAEDCKNDGWRSSGQWKNQGDCVSWFATYGKNEPGQNIPTPQQN